MESKSPSLNIVALQVLSLAQGFGLEVGDGVGAWYTKMANLLKKHEKVLLKDYSFKNEKEACKGVKKDVLNKSMALQLNNIKTFQAEV